MSLSQKPKLNLTKIEFLKLVKEVNDLPYGRNSDRANFRLIESEGRGTCSTKHAFLKFKAEENKLKDVDLVLCLFKMNGENTPEIGKFLKEKKLDYIPEAHCFIRVEGKVFDISFPKSSTLKIAEDLIRSENIQAFQIGDYKLDFHKKYLSQWLKSAGLDYSFEEIWEIREACIKLLSNH